MKNQLMHFDLNGEQIFVDKYDRIKLNDLFAMSGKGRGYSPYEWMRGTEGQDVVLQAKKVYSTSAGRNLDVVASVRGRSERSSFSNVGSSNNV